MTHPNYFVYILQCSDGTLYTGVTTNIIKRLRQHNGKITGGAKYTRQRRPVSLRYSEKHETYILAAKRERAIKKLSREQKETLCNAYNNTH